MGVYKKLAQIQCELNVPKSREIFLKKGKVSYKKYADIMKALKPLLNKYQACLFMSNEIEAVAPDRVYIKTILKFIDLETEDCIESTALAREGSNTQEGAVAKVYVIASEFRSILEYGGFSYTKCIKEFKERGDIHFYSDAGGVERIQCQKRIQGVDVRVICLNIKLEALYPAVDDFLGVKVVLLNGKVS